MTVNQFTVHPSTMSIPAPLYKIGQQVEWVVGEHPKVREFTGIVTGQTYRINYKGGDWKFTMAITKATSAGKLLEFHVGGYYSDIDENRLCTSIVHE